jgi:diguanylate cyclase (GGDEF)-like protein
MNLAAGNAFNIRQQLRMALHPEKDRSCQNLSVTGGFPNFGTIQFDELRQMSILLVDDIIDNVELIKSMLTRSGFTNILSANSGKTALECLQQQVKNDVSTVDLALLDIMMPGMDGYELCRILRGHEEWADIPVIMITANASWQEKVVRESFEVGATDIMFKPIRRVDLLPKIISALSLKRERDLRKSREQELETELSERRIVEARLQHLVNHDDLTGLCNRRGLEQQLELVISHSRKKGNASALLYIDLDHFKVINDAEGHAAGDRLLIEVANVFRHEIGTAGLLTRISSDEYTVLFEDITEVEALKVAERVRHVMEKFQFTTNNNTYHIGASIGVAIMNPEDIVTSSEFLARADQACYVAKTHGRNVVHLFSKEDTEMLTLRSAIHWVPLIREALTNNKFMLVFQPILDLKNRTISHYETLIRMIGNDGKLIEPSNFIPVAEKMGLIHDIDLWVVNRAIDILHDLPEKHKNTSFNINLSSHAFQDTALLPLLKEKLAQTGIQAGRITFEITETAAVANFSQTREMIMNLRELGCRFALDDFGSGFSSFNYIKEFPVDYLKIDGAFITNLLHDQVDQTLIKSMIEIAKKLNKKTVAEFVENKKVLDLLMQYGADCAQGYFIGKPSPELTDVQIDW